MTAKVKFSHPKLENFWQEREFTIVRTKDGWATENGMIRWNEDKVKDGVVDFMTIHNVTYRLLVDTITE